jgi:hypothetical protein
MSPKLSLKFTPILDDALARLLSTHDDRQHSGFITHLDRAPTSHKRFVFYFCPNYNPHNITFKSRKAFAKGLIMNLALLALIFWLISVSITLDIYSPTFTPVMTALCVAQDFIIAWAIYSMLITTTIPFFLRECRLRLCGGFRPTEVVLRRPPVLSECLSDEERVEHYRRFVSRSMDSHLIYANFWSFLTSELWVSEHIAILEAHRLIDSGEIDEGWLEAALLRQENGLWNVYEISKIDNMV